ncbi:MAG: hypothetical protein ABWX74_04345 [Aeromicrobium sp.]
MSSEDLIREASDPATTPARLAELAGADQSTWSAIAGNPAAYDGLLTWLGERGDPSVDAALTARAEAVARAAAQAALPPVPPPAPVAPPAPPTPPVAAVAEAPVEAPAPVAPAAPIAPEQTPEPTVVVPAFQQPAPEQPTYEQPAAPAQPAYPTYEQPAYQAPEPTAVFAAPAAVAPEPAAFGSVPPAGTEPATGTTDGSGGSGKNLAIVIAMVAVVLALIGGAAFGATQVFGGDDDNPSISASDDDDKDADADDEVPDIPDVTVPTPDDEPSEDEPSADVPAGASGEFCSTMKQIQDDSMDALDDTSDLEGIQDMADKLLASYESLKDSAPAELQADVEVMSSYFELLQNPDADSADKMSDSISDYAESAQKVGTYYAQNCL